MIACYSLLSFIWEKYIHLNTWVKNFLLTNTVRETENIIFRSLVKEKSRENSINSQKDRDIKKEITSFLKGEY